MKVVVVIATVALFGGLSLLTREFSSTVHERSSRPPPAATPHDELYSVHMNPSGTGWTVGKFGRILQTPDGGRSWSEQESGTTEPLTAVSFSGDLSGIAAGGAGTILTTGDGGRSWAARNSPAREHLLDAQAVTPHTAFVAGAFGTLLSTKDGGATWRKHKFTWERIAPRLLAEKGPVEPNLNTVHFFDDREGWVGGEFGLLLHTQDQGRTWKARRFGGDLPQIVSIRFRDRRSGWAVGSRGTVLRTGDGGQTWRKLRAGTNRDFYSLWIDRRRVILAGKGVALQTSDDGKTWSSIESIQSDQWLSGVAGAGKFIVAVGQAGTVRQIEPDRDGQNSPRKVTRP